MRKLLMLIPLAALMMAAFAGCQRDYQEDIELVKDLLLNSYFTGEGADGVTDDNATTPQQVLVLGETGPQTWVRKITEFNRNVDVSVDGDSAFAVITNHLVGTIYVYNPEADTVYQRPVDDSTYREVILSRGGGKLYGGWKIEKITPVKAWTNNPEHPVEIAKIVVTSVSGVDFEITSPSDFYGRDDVPRFTPEDSVTVEVWLKDTGEDAWAYLHHGRHFRLKYNHHRKVFERDDTDSLKFTGTWVTADDSLVTKATVRHAAVDVILAETLEGDSTAEYSAYAIGFPYIIAGVGEELPDDGSTDNQ